jgi:hypothetical protein
MLKGTNGSRYPVSPSREDKTTAGKKDMPFHSVKTILFMKNRINFRTTHID